MNNMNNDDKDILTFADVMTALGVKKTTMYKIMKQNDPPPFCKLGNKRIITRHTLNEWVKQHEGDIYY